MSPLFKTRAIGQFEHNSAVGARVAESGACLRIVVPVGAKEWRGRVEPRAPLNSAPSPSTLPEQLNARSPRRQEGALGKARHCCDAAATVAVCQSGLRHLESF